MDMGNDISSSYDNRMNREGNGETLYGVNTHQQTRTIHVGEQLNLTSLNSALLSNENTNINTMQDLEMGEQQSTNDNTRATTTTRNLHLNQHWIPPEMGKLKINVDVSFINVVINAGIGLILRNSAGQCLGARGLPCLVSSAEEGEALAILEAHKWVEELSLEHVTIECDATNVINYLKNNAADHFLDWRAANILHELASRNRCNHVYDFVKVPRLANKPADILAKIARMWVNREIWNENHIPSSLYDSLNSDRENYYAVTRPDN